MATGYNRTARKANRCSIWFARHDWQPIGGARRSTAPARPVQGCRRATVLDARGRQEHRDDDEPRLPFAALQAAAIVAAVTAERTGSRAQRVPEVSVLIDLDSLNGMATDGGIVCEADDGTPLPIATVRRLCCDAHVILIVLGSDGAVLDRGAESVPPPPTNAPQSPRCIAVARLPTAP